MTNGVTGVTHYGWRARFRGAGFTLLGLLIAVGSLAEFSGKGNWQKLLISVRPEINNRTANTDEVGFK